MTKATSYLCLVLVALALVSPSLCYPRHDWARRPTGPGNSKPGPSMQEQVMQGPVIEPPQCPIPGQVYMECGSACPPTCDDYFNLDLICPLVCVPGCQCLSGLVLDNDRCVRPKDCLVIEPPQCPIRGQVYMECGSACPPTCDDLNPICPLVCVPGCQCLSGLVLDNDRCVPPKDCEPPQCPIRGQVYMECGSACPPTCDDLNPICPLVCVPGCQCPRGTVLDGKRCVSPTTCDAKLVELEAIDQKIVGLGILQH
ncbi:Mucin-19 [Geodia barretti]|uniref:Mucin-19 n=1 Tax=Geodia barretti TaxID=519541 RepID=A0AA35QWA2_GEOBA|nr:Mucin-19 [Geodia barretti]